LRAVEQAFQTRETQVYEYPLTIQDETRDYEVRLAVSAPDEVVGIIRDITQRKEVERLKDDLVSTVSHELRTPLTSLRGFTELLLTRAFSPEKQRDILFIMQREAERLTNLINDFLDLRRMEAGQEIYQFVPVQLEPVLKQSLAAFLNESGPHTFRVELDEPLPRVVADEDRVHQVLTNLLSNAIKFSPAGGEVILGVWPRDQEVIVWVRDHGIGIPQETLPKIFDRFFRVENGMTRTISGTGLGLALVKEVVSAHRGRVWVESTLGQGSTFFFTLPVAQTAESLSV
jgi:signal transduction histidine kinase